VVAQCEDGEKGFETIHPLPTQSYYIDDGERLVVAGYTE
jgi:hypothetical protein